MRLFDEQSGRITRFPTLSHKEGGCHTEISHDTQAGDQPREEPKIVVGRK